MNTLFGTVFLTRHEEQDASDEVGHEGCNEQKPDAVCRILSVSKYRRNQSQIRPTKSHDDGAGLVRDLLADVHKDQRVKRGPVHDLSRAPPLDPHYKRHTSCSCLESLGRVSRQRGNKDMGKQPTVVPDALFGLTEALLALSELSFASVEVSEARGSVVCFGGMLLLLLEARRLGIVFFIGVL